MGKHSLYRFVHILCRKLAGWRQLTGWSQSKFESISTVTGQKQCTGPLRMLRCNFIDVFSKLFNNIRHTKCLLYFVLHGFSYFYQYKDFVNALLRCGFSDIFLQSLTEFTLDKWLKNTDDMMERYRLVSSICENAFINH